MNDIFKQTCDLCGKDFSYGEGRYNGKEIREWKMMFCGVCYNGNHDGIVLSEHPNFKNKLAEKNIKYSLNKKGYLSIPS